MQHKFIIVRKFLVYSINKVFWCCFVLNTYVLSHGMMVYFAICEGSYSRVHCISLRSLWHLMLPLKGKQATSGVVGSCDW